MFFEIIAERESLKSGVRIFIARDQGHRHGNMNFKFSSKNSQLLNT